MKRSALKRKPASRRPRAPEQWTAGIRWTPCEQCGQERSVHAHHVIYEQVLRREGLDLWDTRNRMLLCFACHAAHHARTRVLELRDDHSVWGFAADHGLTWWLVRTYYPRQAA